VDGPPRHDIPGVIERDEISDFQTRSVRESRNPWEAVTAKKNMLIPYHFFENRGMSGKARTTIVIPASRENVRE
jgi:hypothetical protein